MPYHEARVGLGNQRRQHPVGSARANVHFPDDLAKEEASPSRREVEEHGRFQPTLNGKWKSRHLTDPGIGSIQVDITSPGSKQCDHARLLSDLDKGILHRTSCPSFEYESRLPKLPSIQRSQSTKGFLFNSQRPESFIHTASSSTGSNTVIQQGNGESSPYNGGVEDGQSPHSPTLPSMFKQQQEQAEGGMLWIASKMGLIKSNQGSKATSPLRQSARAGSARRRHQPTATDPRLCSMGVSFQVLLDFASSVSPTLSTGEAVYQHVLQETAERRSRYTDLLDDSQLGYPTHYIIHPWHMNFTTLVHSLHDYFVQLKGHMDDVFIWIDIFCINQHSPGMAALDLATLRDIITGAERVVFVVDRYAAALARTWVVYELWLSLPSATKLDKLVVVLASWAWEDMMHALLTLDVNKTACRHDHHRRMLIAEMTASAELTTINADIRSALLRGARHEMHRAQKLASVNIRRYASASTVYAALLYCHAHYHEAEEVLQHVATLLEKTRAKDPRIAREVLPEEELGLLYHMALVQYDKGLPVEAESLLQDCVTRSSGLEGAGRELYFAAVAKLVEVKMDSQQYTKAEMLCQKVLLEKQRAYGGQNLSSAATLLQLASMSIRQKLYGEAESTLHQAVDLCEHHPRGVHASQVDTLLAECHYNLAICEFHTHREKEAHSSLETALSLQSSRLGHSHPAILRSKMLDTHLLIKASRFNEAQAVLAGVCDSYLSVYGPEHYLSFQALGSQADLLQEMGKAAEAQEVEKRILHMGRALLKHTRIDKLKALAFVSAFVARREHMLEKAAMFLAKSFVVYKEKLGSSAELTMNTKQQLVEILQRQIDVAQGTLQEAGIYNSVQQYGLAEVLFKQSYSISKLIDPEGDHKYIAQGLADALYGQGKAVEAKNVLQAAGIMRNNMKKAMPVSYLRWLNKRVANYLDELSEGQAQEQD